jgi:DNA-binding transcriptional LysR family regulator
MERLNRLSRVWSWLPAFRAVAELEHLGRAAAALQVSPSALSRSVKLLEEELGRPLFHRRGRGLQLSDAGRLLLEHVRDATRWLDEAVTELEEGVRHVVRIGAVGVAAHVHVPQLVGRLLVSHPHLVPEVTTPSTGSIAGDLRQGRLDLALTSTPVSGAGLSVVPLADVTNGVYCGPGHPLYRRERVTADEILAHPFVAPPSDELGRTGEGWPAALPRVIACHLDRVIAGVEACAQGGVLAVLPDVLARRHPAKLRRLDAIRIEHTAVHAIRRRPLGDSDLVGELIDVLGDLA